MAAFHRAGMATVNVFRLDDDYAFKHYFEEGTVFDRLRRYYNEYEYRFEVPADRFEGIRAFLEDHGYALVVVDAPEEFAVAKRKYTNHPRVLFKDSVFHRSAGRFNCFVMKDRDAVEAALAAGAQPLSAVDVDFSP